MIRRSAAGLLVALLCLTAACSGGSDAAPQITSSPSPIASSAAPDPRIAEFKTDNPTAAATYSFAAQFALRYQFNSEYLRLSVGGMVPADFDQFKPLMTSDAFSTLTDAVDNARSGDPSSKDASSVRALTFVDFAEELTNTGLSMRNDPTIVVDQKITKPTYKFLFGYPTIWLTSSGGVLASDDAGQKTIPYSMRLKLEIHETDSGLRINAWDSTWAFNGATPAEIP